MTVILMVNGIQLANHHATPPNNATKMCSENEAQQTVLMPQSP